jgi:hypothetical protein
MHFPVKLHHSYGTAEKMHTLYALAEPQRCGDLLEGIRVGELKLQSCHRFSNFGVFCGEPHVSCDAVMLSASTRMLAETPAPLSAALVSARMRVEA